MRIPMIAANWKMNTTVSEAKKLVTEIHQELSDIKNIDKVICPPFISLATVYELTKEGSIKLGAQNVYFEEKGAYTGEISPLMLTDFCKYVIIGHSERRQYFNETREIINKKIRTSLSFKLMPILCVGESLEENEAGNTEKIVAGQLKSALAGIDYPNGLILAYEPIWAIGTGKSATGEQANKTIGFLRRNINELYNETAAQNVRILYGGSVTDTNTTEFISQPEIDGALVGGASLKAKQFISIVKQAREIKNQTSS
ncbi:MAG: triose-phosphate isomerase [Dehalococcoidales bacterium]|nr:triose-phosphate isomerase [Dehalococcoidales bacterium]